MQPEVISNKVQNDNFENPINARIQPIQRNAATKQIFHFSDQAFCEYIKSKIFEILSMPKSEEINVRHGRS